MCRLFLIWSERADITALRGCLGYTSRDMCGCLFGIQNSCPRRLSSEPDLAKPPSTAACAARSTKICQAPEKRRGADSTPELFSLHEADSSESILSEFKRVLVISLVAGDILLLNNYLPSPSARKVCKMLVCSREAIQCLELP